MPVREVTDKLRVEPNHVYIIPPDKNMAIAQGVLKLKPRPGGRLRRFARLISSLSRSLWTSAIAPSA